LRLAPLGLDAADLAYVIIDEQIETLETWDHDLPEYRVDPQQVQLWREAFADFYEL